MFNHWPLLLVRKHRLAGSSRLRCFRAFVHGQAQVAWLLPQKSSGRESRKWLNRSNDRRPISTNPGMKASFYDHSFGLVNSYEKIRTTSRTSNGNSETQSIHVYAR